jgi:hypothetical protein
MRRIRISTGVFAAIWSNRQDNEHTEDDILKRLLLGDDIKKEFNNSPREGLRVPTIGSAKGKVRWVDDVESALVELGGQAHLSKIYPAVWRIRSSAGRSLPKAFEQVVRKELETHSSDSEAFQFREDIFAMARGKGSGVWAIK